MTKLDYLQDTNKFESFAIILEIKETENWIALILDQTIFYPQWGWQPSDIWEIKWDTWIFLVSKVMLDQEWIVYHYWEFTQWIMKTDDKVALIIDRERRINNTKLHSAWHLISSVVSDVLKLDITPYKWYHFEDSPYVECHWIIDNNEEIKDKIEKEVKILIDKDLNMNIEDLNLEEAEKRWFSAPVWKSVRIVWFDWFESNWCWWTHVDSTKELIWLTIMKVSSKKWKTKISYMIS